MIVVLPTTTGFLVGTLPLSGKKKNKLKLVIPEGPKSHREALAAHWRGVRRWMRAAKPVSN